MAEFDEQKCENSSEYEKDPEDNEEKEEKSEDATATEHLPEESENTEKSINNETDIKMDTDNVNQVSSVSSELNEPNKTESDVEKDVVEPTVETIEVIPKCKVEKPNSVIDEAARKFKNSFFEVVEELKLRRSLDPENETRITSLLTEKNEIHRQWEEAVSKNSSLRDMYEKREGDVVKQFEEKIRQYESDKAKYDISEQCSNKEINQLKDEIRALRLAKYSMEKRASDLDREVQLQTLARENHVKQLGEVEKSYREAVKQSNEVFVLLDQVERNVGAASRLHRKLTYNNEHQNCRLLSYKQSLDEKQQELARVRVIIENQKAMLSTYENNRQTNDNSETELKMQTELCRQLQSLLDETREDNKNLLESLKEAQTLVDRHVDSVKKHSEQEGMAQFELDEVKSECEDLKGEVKEIKQLNKLLHEEMEEKVKAWASEKEEKERKLSEVKEQLEALTLAQNSLEETNSKLSEEKQQLIQEIEVLHTDIEIDTKTFNKIKETQSKQIKDKDDKVKELSSQLSEAHSRCEAHLASSQQWKERFTEMEEKSKLLSNDLSEVQQENSDLKETREILIKNISTEESEMESLKSQLNEAKRQSESQLKSASQSKERLQRMEEKLQEKEEMLLEREQMIQEFKEKIQQSSAAMNSKVIIDSSSQTENQFSIQEKLRPILVDKGITVRESDILDLPSLPNINSDHQIEQEQQANHHNEVNTSSTANKMETIETTGNIAVSNTCKEPTNQPIHQLPVPCVDQNIKDESELARNKDPITANHISVTFPTQSEITTESDQVENGGSINSTPHIDQTVLKSCISKRRSDLNGPPKKRVRFNMKENKSLDATIKPGNTNENKLTGRGHVEQVKISFNMKENQSVDDTNKPGNTNDIKLTGLGHPEQEKINFNMKENQSIDGTTKPGNTNEIKLTGLERPEQEMIIVDSVCKSQDATPVCSSTLNDCQELFSDDDHENTVVKCPDVGQQISQVQQFLNNQRLKTKKKRKFPS